MFVIGVWKAEFGESKEVRADVSVSDALEGERALVWFRFVRKSWASPALLARAALLSRAATEPR